MSLVPVVKNVPYRIIIKQKDQTKSEDIIMAIDDELFCDLLIPNHVYQYDLTLYLLSNNVPRFKYDFTSQAVIKRMNNGVWSSDQQVVMISGGEKTILGNSNQSVAYITGFLTLGAQTSQFAFRWAQSISDGTPATVYAGSKLVVYK